MLYVVGSNLLQCFNFIVFSLLISTNVFLILLKPIYFETADDGIGDANVPYGPGDYLPLVVDVEPPETSLAIEGPFVIKIQLHTLGIILNFT